MTTALAGLFTGLSLIVAIGAQNAFVLRQGIRREHIVTVVAICAVSDLVLILGGTAGVGVLVQSAPWLITTMRLGGAAYLVWFAVSSFRSAAKPRALTESGAQTAGAVVGTTLALTWLNPHVYLDTVVMLGNIANSYGPARWVFAGGAAVASLLWFSVLGFGARSLAGPLGRPSVWRLIDGTVGVVMLILAAKLALG